MSAAALEARGLSKSFGALRVADNISLAFAPGRLHGLIGPNGAGKTTLVNLLSGALKPDSGTVALDGRDVTKLSLAGRSRAGLARTFQTAAILPEFTVEENVAFAAQARAGSSFRFFGRVGAEAGLRAKARATLERVGLAERAATLAGALSHGERRVLEIASALALEPRALLLDEPFAGLGEEDTEAGIRLIASLKGELTLVLIEHDVAAVFALADDVSVLAQGRVLASGTPQQVRENAEVRAAYFGEEEAA
jgi:branched-chain amino acid transport system ATP-binding protein